MLTLKAPIELNCSRRMVSDNESFAERLQVSYKLMSSKVSGEDLLHVLNTPPEIIFAEGDNTSIFNNISNTGTFAQKTEIINHFLNTVLYNGNVELTYKDRVYITDVLMRLCRPGSMTSTRRPSVVCRSLSGHILCFQQ